MTKRILAIGAALVLVILVCLFWSMIAGGAEAFFESPAGFSFVVNLGYFVVGVLLIVAFWLWFNRSNATGSVFEIHAAIDKIYEGNNACAIFLGLLACALAHFFGAFVRG